MIASHSRRTFLGTASLAAAAVMRGVRVGTGAAAERWQPRWILASALYGNFPLAEILPEVAKTGAGMIDLWPKPHGTQREQVDTLGEEKVREMLTAAGVRLGGIACYKAGAFNLAGEFALAKRLGGEGATLVTMAPGDGSAVACVKDNGEGSGAVDGDKLILIVYSGVYTGYSTAGTVRGNVQSHVCE